MKTILCQKIIFVMCTSNTDRWGTMFRFFHVERLPKTKKIKIGNKPGKTMFTYKLISLEVDLRLQISNEESFLPLITLTIPRKQQIKIHRQIAIRARFNVKKWRNRVDWQFIEQQSTIEKQKQRNEMNNAILGTTNAIWQIKRSLKITMSPKHSARDEGRKWKVR